MDTSSTSTEDGAGVQGGLVGATSSQAKGADEAKAGFDLGTLEKSSGAKHLTLQLLRSGASSPGKDREGLAQGQCSGVVPRPCPCGDSRAHASQLWGSTETPISC